MQELLPSMLLYRSGVMSRNDPHLRAGHSSHSDDRKNRSRKKAGAGPLPSQEDKVWQALFLGFISFGISHMKGCWVTRTWLKRSIRRDGVHNTCSKLKDLAVSIRAYVLSDVQPSFVPDIPFRLQRWLRLCVDKDIRSGLAFTRFARALPKPDAKVVAESMASHLDLISERRTVPEGVQEQIEQYTYRKFRGKFVGNLRHANAPISNHAVGECSKAKGGYSAYLNQCEMDPAFLGVDPPLEPLSKFAPTRALWRQANINSPDLLQYMRSVKAQSAARMVERYAREDCLRPVHRAVSIGEQGDKSRIITIPPASLFAAGDLCRQRVWPHVKQADSRIFGSDEAGKASLARMRLPKGSVYVSADLTKATDGFAHDAVRAVLRGLQRAGLDPSTVQLMYSTLGVGHQLHYVKYELTSLPLKRREAVVKRFETVVDADGRTSVLVPMVRGILMGTPCSFTVLSILNGWCAAPLGSLTVICGDDVASATTPETVENYDRRVTIIGSGLHKRKTFIGRRGLLFCELYVLPEFREDRCFEPVPLKSLAKDGDGTLDTKHFDTFIWKRMDRACRVLWRDVRAKARRLGRWPVLPVELGGLGHPSSGKMGAVPGSVRNRLATLIKEMSPMPNIPRWRTVCAPLSWSEYKNDESSAWELFEGSVASVSQLEADSRYEDTSFVSYREARSYVSIIANELYTGHGGRFAVEEDRRKSKQARVQYPGLSSLQYSSKAPMSMVAREYCQKLDAEGEYLPFDSVRKIRGRTHKSGRAS